ncbi:MAG: radical SAM protein [Myxococcota bacterium]
MPYHTTPWTFYDAAVGLCSQCLRRVQGRIVFENDKVWFDKRCPTHGRERVLLDEDIAWFRRGREGYLDPGGQPNQPGAPARHGCPYDCGLCPEHQQHTCVAILEITDACNLTCPVCYAASGPHRQTHRSLAEIDAMLAAVMRSEDSLNVLQISGGEPTLHPDFFAIVERTREFPIKHLMVNTNGIRIARDRAFAERLAACKPHFEVYLQFDSLRGDRLKVLRGEDLTRDRDRALAVLEELGVSTSLVVTLVPGVNDDEIGDILRHALTFRCVRGVTLQPMQAAGRTPALGPDVERLTSGGVRRRILEQCDVFRPEDIVPVPCHSDSLAMAYAFKVMGAVAPLSSILDPTILLASDRNSLLYEHDRELGRKLYDAFSARHSPSSHTAALRELLDCLPDAGCLGPLTYENVFRLMIIQFMDAASLELRAVQRSCIHIIHPDGRLVPFDTFNVLHRPGNETALAGALEASGIRATGGEA